jgi:transposase
MKFIHGTDRTQLALFPTCLDDSLDFDNETRLIDLFVNSLDLKSLGFEMDFIDNGRPAYHPGDLLRLFIYGYLNRIRSSRALERECRRNIELMWLMKGLVPDHNTISNFRKDNPAAIKKVFRATVQMAKHFELIGGTLLAGDSTKLRAQNSKKNNFNTKKIERHLAYIEEKLAKYQAELAKEDGDVGQQEILAAEIKKQSARKAKYESLGERLDNSDQEQISTSDPDSRQMIIRNNITEVAYNIQSTTDAKHHIPIDFKVTNNNDSKAMGNMVRRAKSILRTNHFTALFDKGYHTGSEIKTTVELGVEPIVAIPAVSGASMAPDPAFNVSEFTYDPQTRTYTCPQGSVLSTNGTWYKKDRGGSSRKSASPIRVQHFKTKDCKGCPVLDRCTKNTRGRGRVIERTEHQDYIDINRKNVGEKEHLYKRRQAIIEHNYGTMKRQWNFHYIITKKGMDRASSDVGLIFTAYNLRRIFNLVGPEVLKAYLKALWCCFLALMDLLDAQKTPEYKTKIFDWHSGSFKRAA